MPMFFTFLAYLGVALLLTALLYFPVFQLVSIFWEVRPDRVFYRLAMIIAIIGFWPFLRWRELHQRDALGYAPGTRDFLKIFSRGVAIGILILLFTAVLLLAFGARVPVPGLLRYGDLAAALFTGMLSGILVALIEETFFRGALQTGMRRHSSLLTTVICINLLYAALHFTRPPISPDSTAVDWQSGWTMLTGMLHQFGDFGGIADSFAALFVAGLLLSLIRENTGNIALCAGIHAGWVLTIRVTREVTDAAHDAPTAWMIGSYDNITGWAATAVLGLLTLWYWHYRYRKHS